MDLLKQLEHVLEEAETQIPKLETLEEIDEYRVRIIGRSGQLTELMKEMRHVEPADRPAVGKMANKVRTYITDTLEQAKEELETAALEEQLIAEKIDVTLPGQRQTLGQSHLITQTMDDIAELFLGMGYEIIEGTEIVSDELNFERVNVPQDHPARDMQDSFYVNNHYLLRTQTSAIQPLILEAHDFSKGPLKVISPGKVYRRDSDDATHSHQFHQIEGMVVDKGISMSDLLGTLELMSQSIFGKDRTVRFRPSYFPFTEPSVEVDVSCFKCEGAGCNVCKQSGWIEILGAGMIHPNVLELSGIDSSVYTGFAFGTGPDRMAMLEYGVNDIREFYLNDERFLKQFAQGGQ